MRIEKPGFSIYYSALFIQRRPALDQRHKRARRDKLANALVAVHIDRLVEPQVVRAHKRIASRRQVQCGRIELSVGAVAGQKGATRLQLEMADQIQRPR